MTSLLLISLLSVGHAKSPIPVKLPPAEPVAPVVEAPPVDPRATPPAVRAPVPLPLPTPELHALSEGVNVQFVRIPGVRRVEVVTFLHRGSVALCGAPSPACDALGQMLGVSTEKTDAEAMEGALALLDAELSGGMGLRDTTLRLAVPAEGLEPGLALMREALLEPVFPKKEIKLLVRDTLQSYLTVYPTDPGQIARMVRDDGWFPADHPMGARPDLDGYKKLKSGRLSALHQTLMDTAPVTVLVVGDIGWETLEPALKKAYAGVGHAGARPGPIPFTPPKATRVLAVELAGQSQVSIRMRMAAPTVGDPSRPAFQASHFALAGSFLSRLNKNIREEKGWTYGVGGRYTPQSSAAVWDVGLDVAAENTAAAITEIQAELARFVADGPSDVELSSAGVGQVQTWNEELATAVSARAFYADLIDDDETLEAARARVDAVGALNKAVVQQAAGQWLKADAPQLWVLVGDRAAIEAQLSTLHWQATWLSASDAVLGRF